MSSIFISSPNYFMFFSSSSAACFTSRGSSCAHYLEFHDDLLPAFLTYLTIVLFMCWCSAAILSVLISSLTHGPRLRWVSIISVIYVCVCIYVFNHCCTWISWWPGACTTKQFQHTQDIFKLSVFANPSNGRLDNQAHREVIPLTYDPLKVCCNVFICTDSALRLHSLSSLLLSGCL